MIGSAAACSPAPNRPPFTFDLGMRDASIVDAGQDAATSDAGGDSSTMDSGNVDAGVIVGCTAGTPMELFRTAYLIGLQVPYGAEANVDGLLVAATVRTEANYPFFDRIAGYMSQSGGVSTPQLLSPSTMAMSTSISIAQSNNGFLAVFDETASLGTLPTDLWRRTADSFGIPMGTAATQVTVTPSVNESGGRIVRTSVGFAAAWNDDTSGLMTAALDATGAIVGSSHAVPAAVGSPSALIPYTIAGSPYFAYFGADQKVHGAAMASDGTLSASPVTLSALTTTGNFAVGSGASGAGLAYELPMGGGKTVLQFRAINANGSATLAERLITAVGEQGQRPSVVGLAGGYLVLYRRVPASGAPTLTLGFVSATGDPLSSVDLVANFPAEPRFSVHVSPDNEVYVVYHEPVTLGADGGINVPGASVKAIRVVCQ